MMPYANRSGNSGVVSFEIAEDSISIEFRDGHTYQYTYSSAGQRNVERMKRLARNGQGLSTFISQNVKNDYARKWRRGAYNVRNSPRQG